MSKSYLIPELIIISAVLFSNIMPAQAEYQPPVVNGTVLQNSHRCAVDGICFLELQKMDGTTVQITYGWESLGEGIICHSDKALSDLAWAIKPGQVIEAKGQYAQDGKTILLCAEQNHYLKIISPQ